MRRALCKVTPELLTECLKLPDGSEIDGVVWNPTDRTVILSVQHPDLPEVPRYDAAPFTIVERRWRT